MIKKFVISPPFGTYITHPCATSVKGSFTVENRPGKWLQVAKTLRYTKRGWVNKIGLRNPGLYSLKKWDLSKIYSFYSETNPGWEKILDYVPDNLTIEANLSCPNVDTRSILNSYILDKFVKRPGLVILKLSPLCDANVISDYYDYGMRYFHLSNTLAVKEGGLSGRELQEYNLPKIKWMKNEMPEAKVIGGGGIYDRDDLKRYEDAGADHFSLATVWFTPWRAYPLLKSPSVPD